MKDIFGQDLEIDDKVAFNPPYYKGLVIGTITGFTPQKVKVHYKGADWVKDITLINPIDLVKKVLNKE